MEIDKLISNLHTLEASQATNHEYKVFVSTWNVGGVMPQDDTNLEDMLGSGRNLYDIYIFGFQEVVPLNAKNVLRLDEGKSIPMKWNSLIGRTLNNSISSTTSISCHDKTTMVVDQKGKIYPMKDGNMEDGVDDIGIHGSRFQCIITKQMVGILVAVWVRSDLKPYIHHQAVSCVGCGILGYLGNKGAVSVRFFLHETSFCFVCCHLASGGKEGDKELRNGNVTEIFARTRFHGGSRCNLPRKIKGHECDRILWHGKGLYQEQYSSGDSRLSDHRPVRAVFSAVALAPVTPKPLMRSSR